MTPDDPLARFHRDTEFQPLSRWWAKVEIFLGLATVGAAVIGAVNLGVEVIQHTRAPGAGEFGLPLGPAAGLLVLFVLGGYLALAGHRSHLYQSNNRTAAYLAELLRGRRPGPPDAAPAAEPPPGTDHHEYPG